MNGSYFAHTTKNNRETWQDLTTHLKAVGDMAKAFAAVFNAGEWGYWAGLLHDVGKFSPDFQRYMATGIGRTDHSTAGARLVCESWQSAESRRGMPGKELANVVALCIAGHHAGLPDLGSIPDESGTLMHRLSSRHYTIKDYSAWEKMLPLPSISTATPLPDIPCRVWQQQLAPFTLAFFVRMLFSCLTDADYLDTERFCDAETAQSRNGWASLSEVVKAFEPTIAKLSSTPVKEETSPVNPARREILEHCLAAASLTPGVFSLTVPTGGGKTYSSLAFALKHAMHHGLRRIIYVIPYTSIIEQNAEVFRKALGNELADRALLEHHSTYIHPDEGKEGMDETSSASDTLRFRLATQNWDAPLVVTTSVQFFESLFASRSSGCRKLHNIANSVIILDEAQMLPPQILQPSVAALRELAANYGTSIVLCTATQPALAKAGRLKVGFPEGKIREIIPANRKAVLFSVFRRTQIVQLGVRDDADIASRLRNHDQVLCIVNKRQHARDLFMTLGKADGHFHLSARMYPAHRKQVLNAIRKRLEERLPCRVVSTSLVECGVDVDFPHVYRATAGLDSIAQAAGRCNREGKISQGIVYLFRPATGMPKNAPDFQRRVSAFETIAPQHDDLFSPQAVQDYFTTLYRDTNLDTHNILRLAPGTSTDALLLSLPQMARDYRFIESDMQSIIVTRDEEARRLVTRLETQEHISGVLRALQSYTVQVYRGELDELLKGCVSLVRGQFYVAHGGAGYDDTLGLCVDDPTYWELGMGLI
ncbi:CRISPR-associated helicase Cas3' [Desulfovibrio subterraneus]|uniref:CRISPR-associated helicase Cas3' n=1 Tax=Desulfovibrio subterraneus TaxID=2718620 RepID=UPI0022B94023|nr:CRISPR-associated helicase Cas3' [Desulfovibrio subterraneus]WBF68507.1 CRISPR-associated helicase Cas3' [Desulfovibrio subterraneus]